jgi:chromosome segregation ATPase
MNRRFRTYFLALLTLIFIAGCSTTQELKTTITSKVSSITDSVDPALVNQLPADKKEGFPNAEFNLDVASQKLKLAELKSELAAGQKKYAGLEEDLAGNFQKEAAIDYDLVKIEAIINSALGKKEDNLKVKANLQSKKLSAQADRIKINANIEATKMKSESLSADIAKLDEAIKAMKFTGGKTPEPKKSEGK